MSIEPESGEQSQKHVYGKLSAIYWGIWIYLVGIFVTTIACPTDGHHDYWALLLFALLLLAQYLCEGLDFAATTLLDKEPKQLGEDKVGIAAQRILKDIKHRGRSFIANKQVFDIVLVAGVTLLTDFSYIQIPWFHLRDPFQFPWIWVSLITDNVSRHTSIFSFLFASFTLLWFCQVTPKALADINAGRFLKQAEAAWVLINVTSMAQLSSPGEDVVHVVKHRLGYKHKKPLDISKADFYNIASHRYGLAWDQVSVSFEVDEHGGGKYRKKMLVLFLQGKHHRTTVAVSLPVPRATAILPTAAPLAAARFTLPEKLETMAELLNSFFEPPVVQSGVSTSSAWNKVKTGFKTLWNPPSQDAPTLIEIDDLRPTFTWMWDPEASDNEASSICTIETDLELPDGYNPGKSESNPDWQVVALLYSIEGILPVGTLKEEDSWSEVFLAPCRRYDFSVSLAGPYAKSHSVKLVNADMALVGYDFPLNKELADLKDDIASRVTPSVPIEYPIQSCIYTLEWRTEQRAQSVSI